ncbi:ABC transporter substrate-binding protein [Candidatus Dependentiae bacterium]
MFDKHNVGIFFSDSNAPVFYNSKLKNFVNITASSYTDGATLASYLLENYNFKKIAIFYQTEAFSEGEFNGAKDVLQKANLIEGKNWIAAFHAPNSININSAAQKIKNFNPQAILLLSLDIPTKALLQKLGTAFLFEKKLIGCPVLGTRRFQDYLKSKQLKCIYSQNFPSKNDTSIEIVKELHELVNPNEIGLSCVQGFIVAKLFIYILGKIKGRITPKKILEQAEKIKNLNFKGIEFNFNPKTRNLAKHIWLNVGQDKFIKKKIYKTNHEKISETTN